MQLRFAREHHESDVAPRLLWTASELILDALPSLSPNTRILEVKAGGGVLSASLVERIAGLARLVSIDDDASLVHKLPGIRGRAARARADAQTLPFVSSSFDVVITNLWIGDADQDADRLSELSRVLRTGGWLLSTSFLRGSFDSLLDVLTETFEADGLFQHREALLDTRRNLPDEDSLARACRGAGIDVVHLGVEERGLLFENGAAVFADPLIGDVLLPAWLGAPLAASWRGTAHKAANAIDTYFAGAPFTLRLKTAIATGRARVR